MTIFKQLLLQLVLILLNALFAATELAMVSVNEKKVRAQAEDGDKKAKKLLRVIEDPNKFLSAIQVGITLAGFPILSKIEILPLNMQTQSMRI